MIYIYSMIVMIVASTLNQKDLSLSKVSEFIE